MAEHWELWFIHKHRPNETWDTIDQTWPYWRISQAVDLILAEIEAQTPEED